MARNEEKAQSMLSRYLQTKKAGINGSSSRRPYLATLCDDVDEAEKWRHQILGDIRRKVSEIQNAGVGDEQVRELNDSINKLLRERKHWERRILALGGRNHVSKRERGQDEVDGKDGVFEHNGFFYFGAARNLPGVQELIDRQRGLKREELERRNEESSASIHGRLDIGYFGYLDDHDGCLVAAEGKAEKLKRNAMIKEWEEKGGGDANVEWDTSFLQFVGRKPSTDGDNEIQAIMLERKKAEALEQLEIGVKEATERRG